MAVALHHRLAGKKVLTPEDLHERMYALPAFDGKQHVITVLTAVENIDVVEIKICDGDLRIFLCQFCSECIHIAAPAFPHHKEPLMKILPVEWDYKMPYGLLYAKDPSEKVEKLVRTVEGITK